MKKIFVVVTLLSLICILLSACNRAPIDFTYNFARAIIYLPNGESIEGRVQNWRDYDSSDMMQVKIDGKTYLTHSSNVLLIAE